MHPLIINKLPFKNATLIRASTISIKVFDKIVHLLIK
jgi:hypothetical protein